METLKEKDILKACLDYLAYSKAGELWRQNSGAMVSEYHGKKRFMRFGKTGCADITGILKDGRRVEIEVKGPGGKQSPAQKEFQIMIEKNHGLYILVTSVNDLIERSF